MPLDKEKGLVKDKNILSGAEHRLLLTSERGLEPKLWDIAAASLTVRSLHPTIDTDRNYDP